MIPSSIADLFARFEKAEPEPRTELYFTNPYTLLVAVTLSAQTTDVAVNKAAKPLFSLADNPKAMLSLGIDRLESMISSIGLYRNKARFVIEMAQILIDEYNEEVPLERGALQGLPGVGRKTASVVLNELGIETAIAVDTHVFRLSHRLGLSAAKTPDQVELELLSIIPESFRRNAHHWLILHGRYVCKAKKPECATCLVFDLCPKIGV
jgi:endonuclease III